MSKGFNRFEKELTQYGECVKGPGLQKHLLESRAFPGLCTSTHVGLEDVCPVLYHWSWPLRVPSDSQASTCKSLWRMLFG